MINNDFDVMETLCREILKVEDKKFIEVNRLGGLTNRNYKVTANHQEYMFRLPGEGTKELINRKEEHICTSLANEIGIDSELIYFENTSGIKISRYIYEAETMNKESIKNKKHMQAVAKVFKKMHSCSEAVPVIFDVFEKIEEYEVLLRKCKENFLWDDYKEIKKDVLSLKEKVDNMNIKITMCHNDPLCENFVKGKDKMYLVDWEYAGMNDPMWDLADLFIEAEFTADEEDLFNSFYFGQEVEEQAKYRILINKIFLDFLWSLWGLQRYSCGADLLDYANDRYARAKRHLKLLYII
jgi:thiamine kinase-like enzyme